ncbi:hypothetical protein DWB63_05385 [Pseudodesulfovibrio sp. S3]|nr:hypothetical protein [Pseudodesulfovibrio sp. S3-i]RWU06099.1 hypothetical protein DWB63_05385 [Pseudodesulfovibrio sp. S3]
MISDDNNVHKFKTIHDSKNADDSIGTRSAESAAVAATSRDMSKVAVIVSLLVVVLLVIFFFGMNRNIAGLTEEVKGLGSLRQEMAGIDQRLVQMEQGMPSQMKKMIAQDIVNEMAMKAAHLGNTLEDEQLRDKMQQVLQTLKEVRQGLEQ